MKLKLAVLFLCVAAFLTLGGGFLYLILKETPPNDAELVRTFDEHRAAFEQLKTMLVADRDVRAVAKWGVMTSKGTFIPPEGGFPVDRFNKYLELLKQVSGSVANQNLAGSPNPSILVWASGDLGHIYVIWQDDKPAEKVMVSSLDSHYRKRTTPYVLPVYRHLDQNWYLFTDF